MGSDLYHIRYYIQSDKWESELEWLENSGFIDDPELLGDHSILRGIQMNIIAPKEIATVIGLGGHYVEFVKPELYHIRFYSVYEELSTLEYLNREIEQSKWFEQNGLVDIKALHKPHSTGMVQFNVIATKDMASVIALKGCRVVLVEKYIESDS